MAKKKTSQKNYSAADYLNIARDAEKKSSREAELRESRDATDYLNIARKAQGETPISRRKEQKEEQQPVTAAEKLNRAALLMSQYPAAGDLKRQEINRMAGNLQQAAARNYKSNGQNWNLAGTGSVFDPIGTTAGRRTFEGGLDAELLKRNLEKLTQQQKKQQETEKLNKGNASLVKNGKGGGGAGFGGQNEKTQDRINMLQNALYEAENAKNRAQWGDFDRQNAAQDLQKIDEKKTEDEKQREADYLDMAGGDENAWLSPAEMQALKEKNDTFTERHAQEEKNIKQGVNRSGRYQYEAAMDTDSNFDRLAEEGRNMDTRLKNAEEVLAYPHDKRAAAEAEKLVKYTTDAEKKTYYYTLRTQGQEAADDYLKTLDTDLNRRRGEAQLEATRQTVNSGWLGTVGANAYSVLSSVGETPAYITNLIRSLRGEEIDPYSSENMVSRVNEEIRNQTSQNIQEGVPGFGGQALSFAYGVGMDLARSRYNMMLGLGLGGTTKIGKWTSSALMGTSAAQSTLTDALDRGATDGQAVATSIASGIWETLFEEVSLEKLLDLKSPKTVRQFLTNTLLQSATEGSEELFTEMANTVSDELIMRDLSNYRLNKKAYEMSGMTPEEAQKNALADIAKNWGMAALGGFASGAVGAGTHQLLALGANRQQSRLQQAAQNANQTAQQTNRQETVQNLEQAAETAQQNGILNNNEQNVTNEKQTTKTQRERAGQAQYEGGGVSENVEIDRQNPVSRVGNGTVYLRTQDGSDVRASDVTFGDERDNLLAAEGVHRMSTSGISGMLENYDASKATAEEYAKAYMAVYNRARAGMNVQQAVYSSQQTQNALTQEAAMAAYAAGERMQTVKIIPMTREEKTRRDAQLKLVEAINQKFAKTGVKIEMVDRIEGYGGQEMNGRWDSQTNTIQVSKNASENAYAYIAMHELTHALKSQNASEFEGFSDWVTYYLNENGQDADALVRSEMIARAQAMGLMERQKSNLSVEEQMKLLDSLSEEQYRQLNELAQEEVVCNTVPAILQNENVLMDLYQTKPTLFEKIKNFLKDFIDAVRGTGEDLSRTRAFQQMEGLAKDTAALEDIYNRMVKMAENIENGSVTGRDVQEKFSLKEDVEETKDMIAMNNISKANLKSMIEIGGMPSPSIGVTLSKKGHTAYGEISLVFDKSTIDPKNSRKNRLYGHDAWTPRVRDVEDTFDKTKWSAFAKKLKNSIDFETRYELQKHMGFVGFHEIYNQMGASNPKGSTEYDVKSAIEQIPGTIEAKMAYLADKGVDVDTVLPKLEDYLERSENEDADVEAFAKDFGKKLGELAKDEDVKRWVEKETDGIYQGKAFYDKKTKSMIAFTPENMLKHMHEQKEYGNGTRLDTIWASGAKKYYSIDEMKQDSGRLAIDETEKMKRYKEIDDAIEKVVDSLEKEIGITDTWHAEEWQSDALHNAQKAVLNAAKLKHTPEMISSYLRGQGVKAGKKTLQQIMHLYDLAAETPTDYFEAKPDRVVGFDEVKAMIVPNSMVSDVQGMLDNSGIQAQVVGYEDGNDQSRIAAMNSEELDRYKFSVKEDSDFEYDEDSNLTREQQRQVATPEFKRWFGDSKVVDEDGKPLVVYHGTDADFTVFDREKLGQYTSENTDNEAAIESAKVGFWFSENDLREKTGNKKTMEVYLSIENPMETDLYTMLDVLENMTADEYRAELEEEGHDGLIVTDQEFDNAKSYVVFKPNQIKSAADNVGTFDYFNPDIRYSLKEDSDGNELTERQAEYFADSKIRDEDGRLMVMYHGTPNGNFDKFRSGTYFTPMADYAENYQNPNASSISVKRNADAPTTYKAYLNMVKPFDTRNAEERKIFMEEFYRKYGTGTPLMESGLPDWVDGMDLQEFLQDEMGYDYDGLILDEGGVPDEKGGVKSRGLSYVIFDPSQAKTTDNLEPTSDERYRYSLKETDEDVKKQVELTGEIMRQTGGYRLTEADAERVMRRVTKEFGSQADVSQLTQDFARVMEYARQENADMNQVDNELLNLADKVLENSAQLDTEHEQEMKPIRDKLRKTAISLTDSQKAEAASLTGSLGAFRRALFGRVNLSQKNGVSLDSVWSELSDLSPTLFPADATEGDMPRLLMEAVDATKPVFENQYSMDSEEMTQYAVMQMMDQYMQLPGVKTAAKNQQRMGLTATQYREIMDAFRQKSEKTFQDAWVKVWMQKEKAGKAEAEAKYREWKQDKRQEMRDWRKEQQQAMQEKYREWRRTDTETRKNREEVNTYRDRLERTTNTLLRWMEKPNQTQHIPEALAADVQKVLTGLDFSGKNTLAAKDLGSRIDALAGRIFELQEKTDENGATNQTFYLERDQQMVDELHHLAAKIGASNGSVYELSASELKDLNQWMAAVKHVITDVNKNHAKYYQGKFYRGESQYHTIEEVADATKAELHQRRAYADKKGVTRAWNEMLGKGMIDCFSFFDKMGSAGQEVFGNLRKGFDKHVRNVDAAKTYTEKVLEGIDQKELRQWTDEKKRTEYKTDRGETIRLNTAEVMELYVLSKREQAQSHLYGQGIRTNEKVEPVMLTRGDVSRITGTLTDGQKQIADKLQRFLAQDCASWGNEASRALVGYDKFGEKNYWPIRTDPNSNRTLNADGSAANLSYIKNQGFTKDVTEKAQNAIMVESIFGTYTRHISSMSAYNAYAVAMTDMQRWFNTPGVKTEIERAFGTNGTRYITDLMKQINGTADNGKTFGGAKDMVNKLVGHAKASAVGANLSVAIQQPTAYVRAADMISPKYLAAGLKGKTDIDLVKKWCPIAAWKSWGFYETDIGRGLNSLLVDQSTALERATEKSMVLAEKGDEMTWKALWRAVEAETRDLYEGELEPGTDEFYERVGQRLSDIIDKTQVVDSIFHRSPIMRDRGFSAIYTSFMAEPIKTYNMVERAISNFAENRNDQAAKRKLMRTVSVYVLNGLAGAMAKSVVSAARDDDKDKNYWEKYLESLGENTMDNLLFTNNIPVVSDYLDTLRGNEPSRLDLQSIDRVRQLVNEVPKMIDGTSKWSTFKGMYKFAQMASDITGVPAYAAIRDAKAIVQTVGDALGQDWYIPMQNETATFGYAAENLYEAIRKGDSKREERLRQKLGETKSPSQIDTAVAGVMMEQDSRIAEAAALKLQGKASELNEKKAEIVADGFTAEMVDKAVNQYITSGQTEKAKDLTKELKANLWSRDEAVTAIRTAAGLEEGSATADDVKAIVSELVADSTAQDPAKTVKSGIVSDLKKEYVSLTEEGKTAEAKSLLGVMQETLGVTAEDAKGWVTEGHQESLRNAAEAMDVKALKAAMTKLKKDGKTDLSMKSSIEGVMKKQYTAAKAAGDRGQMEKIVRFLTELELKNAKGEKYFTREKIEAWGEDD